MFRITRHVKSLLHPGTVTAPALPARPGPVVIWNLVRRCNLVCKHCYSISADTHFPGELNTDQVYRVMDDLSAFGVPALILSGGEPLLRPDIFHVSRRARKLGFYVGLSTNGTLIDESNIESIAEVNYDYVGISIDGLRETHDEFRRMKGAFDASMRAVELCKQSGIKVGLRFTLTRDNARDLPAILELIQQHGVDKFYLSHLNYAGRGYNNRRTDAWHLTTRRAMDLLFDHCRNELTHGIEREYVTGNNDADGVYLLQWAQQHFPGQAGALRRRLENWGGNATGTGIANIDNLGEVHPDTFWWNYPLGNVKRTPFSKIWRETRDPLMRGLRSSPRPVKGRCAGCRFLSICGGNTRVRAYRTTGDPWAEDPGCYLTDEEIGVTGRPAHAANTTLAELYKSTRTDGPAFT